MQRDASQYCCTFFANRLSVRCVCRMRRPGGGGEEGAGDAGPAEDPADAPRGACAGCAEDDERDAGGARGK